MSIEGAYKEKNKQKKNNKLPLSSENILQNTRIFGRALSSLLKMINRSYLKQSSNIIDDIEENNWLHDGADITWMDDADLFNKITKELSNDFVYGGYDDELDAIKEFVQDINEGKIKSLKTVAHNFRTLKAKVKNEEYINNYIQRLKQALFGDSLENIEQPEFHESIAEKVKRKNQGLGLKILTPKQMLSRLPTLLAEIQAGNNSKQLKSEARQLIYSLYTLNN